MYEIKSEIFSRRDNAFVKRPMVVHYYWTERGAQSELETMIKNQNPMFDSMTDVEVAHDTVIKNGRPYEHITYVYPVGDSIDKATVYRTYITK